MLHTGGVLDWIGVDMVFTLLFAFERDVAHTIEVADVSRVTLPTSSQFLVVFEVNSTVPAVCLVMFKIIIPMLLQAIDVGKELLTWNAKAFLVAAELDPMGKTRSRIGKELVAGRTVKVRMIVVPFHSARIGEICFALDAVRVIVGSITFIVLSSRIFVIEITITLLAPCMENVAHHMTFVGLIIHKCPLTFLAIYLSHD